MIAYILKNFSSKLFSPSITIVCTLLFTSCSESKKIESELSSTREINVEDINPDEKLYWYDSINMDQDSLWGISPEPKPVKIIVDFETYGFRLKPITKNYTDLKVEIKAQKKQLKELITSNKITKDSVYNYFNETLINKIIPYWYGTEWTFEGHSNVPQKGSIACGYFVSTTLKHMDTQLDRFLLAKQSALNEAKSLSATEPIIPFYNKSPKKVIDHIKKHFTEGVYMVGLDFHVGYLVYRKNEVFFIHSSYFEPPQVVIELAIQSLAFNNSRHYFISKISHNEDFINKWLNNEELKIVLDK